MEYALEKFPSQCYYRFLRFQLLHTSLYIRRIIVAIRVKSVNLEKLNIDFNDRSLIVFIGVNSSKVESSEIDVQLSY